MGHTSPQPNLPAGPSCSHVTDVETEAQEGPNAILMLKSGFSPLPCCSRLSTDALCLCLPMLVLWPRPDACLCS